jgi:hypothetical protein
MKKTTMLIRLTEAEKLQIKIRSKSNSQSMSKFILTKTLSNEKA